MRDVIGPLARVTLAEPSQQQANDNGCAKTQRPKTRRRKQSGTVTTVRRINSDFRLNPHRLDGPRRLDEVHEGEPEGAHPPREVKSEQGGAMPSLRCPSWNLENPPVSRPRHGLASARGYLRETADVDLHVLCSY